MQVVPGAAYERRLDEAVTYLICVGADAAVQELLDDACDALPKRPARAPCIGREDIIHNPEALEVLAASAAVRKLLGDDAELREYISKDHLMMYVFQRDCIHLLTLRHSRQCGFNLSEV